MGTWGAGIYSDDTAQDLRDEYVCAFYKYGIDEALQKIDEYVRTMFDESDEQCWCAYRYSLADFMWKKGILTPEVRDCVIKMIDSGFGLEEWEDAGKSALRERKKVLDKLRTQLLSEQPAPKKIKPNFHLNQIFDTGDFVAIRLQTAGKKYACSRSFSITEENFHALDGKFIVVQKIRDNISWQSRLVPEIHDIWARFRLCTGFFSEPLSFDEAMSLPDADFSVFLFNGRHTPIFWCESSMVYFRRRKYVLLGNEPGSAERLSDCRDEVMATFGNDYDGFNPDSYFAAGIMNAQKE